jgi:BirA family biotin operon repressor/biotin-[acetyl-CoA-carboxylase] ligase
MSGESLDVARLRERLAELCVPFDLIYIAEVDSTNRVLTRMDVRQIHHGISIITDFQSAGRGRLDRSWIAPPCSSVLLSIALALPVGCRATDTPAVGALAIADAIGSATGQMTDLKWPNDVLIGGRKVSGVLVEIVRRGATHYAIIGLGINVNLDGVELMELGASATSLSRELGRPVCREDVVSQLFVALDMWYRCLQRDSESLHTSWRARLGTIGSVVVVADGLGDWEGLATDVRRDGGLVVRKDDGDERTVYAGDVSVRPVEGFTTTD